MRPIPLVLSLVALLALAGSERASAGAPAALSAATAAATATPAATPTATAALAPAAPPNILLAIADDWGWPHAGAYGDPVVRTPTFDRLAREGVLFDHAYAASPSCTPSRAALLTGQWHWRLEESANLWSTLRRDYPVYPELLAQAGYHVGLQGKGWGPGRLEPGGRTENPAGPEFPSFEAFLEKRRPGQPFAYWFGSSDPHRDYDEGKGAASGIDLGAIRLFPHFPDARAVRSDVADYYWEVQRFDSDVGRMLDLLETRGEAERTVVVVTGDNGMPFPRCKANLYDCGVRVPLVVRWQGRFAAGRRLETFVSLTDLAPTFLALAGVPAPAATTGRSLLPLLGLVEPPPAERASRDHVLAGKERHVPGQERPDTGGTPMRSVRTHDFLYIRNFRPDRWPAGTPDAEKAVIEGRWLADCDNGPTKLFLVENQARDAVRPLYDLAFAKRPAEELYDLREDPGQLTNVAGERAYAEVHARLAARLQAELEATADPRVVGGADRLEAYPYYGGSPMKPGFPPPPR